MPKAKPDQVVVHRIELQEKERDLLEQYVVTNTVATAVPATLAAAGIFIAGYGVFWFFDASYNIIEKAKAVATTMKESAKFWEPPRDMTPEEKQDYQETKVKDLENDELVLWTFTKKIFGL